MHLVILAFGILRFHVSVASLQVDTRYTRREVIAIGGSLFNGSVHWVVEHFFERNWWSLWFIA